MLTVPLALDLKARFWQYWSWNQGTSRWGHSSTTLRFSCITSFFRPSHSSPDAMETGFIKDDDNADDGDVSDDVNILRTMFITSLMMIPLGFYITFSRDNGAIHQHEEHWYGLWWTYTYLKQNKNYNTIPEIISVISWWRCIIFLACRLQVTGTGMWVLFKMSAPYKIFWFLIEHAIQFLG